MFLFERALLQLEHLIKDETGENPPIDTKEYYFVRLEEVPPDKKWKAQYLEHSRAPSTLLVFGTAFQA